MNKDKKYNNNIKNLRPRKNSKYHQGFIPESLCTKLFNTTRNEPIIYRSGLELQFIEFCESNPKIKRWASEPISIKYFNRLNNKEANYYPDYVIETTDNHKIIIEIKPYNQTLKPSINDSKWLKEQWIKNVDKWEAAKEFAHKHNAKFMVITEKFFE